jgi:hypothetical protein
LTTATWGFDLYISILTNNYNIEFSQFLLEGCIDALVDFRAVDTLCGISSCKAFYRVIWIYQLLFIMNGLFNMASHGQITDRLWAIILIII